MIRVSRVTRIASLGSVLLLLGCASQPQKESVHPVVQMAQFDLDCPRSEIQYTNSVKVCRQKVGYHSFDEECQWVQN